MSRSRRIGALLVILSLANAGAVYSQQDEPGCKDPPMFTRMKNFRIDNCSEKTFDRVDFRNAKGEDTKVEGHVFRIHYAIKEGSKPPTGLAVARNYANAIKRIGGATVYDGETEVWLKADNQGKLYWVHVDGWDGGGDGETYGLTIVEQEPMAQEVKANHAQMRAAIEAAGHAAIYGIHFDLNKAEIKPESEAVIREIAILLRQNEALKLYIVGHTDSQGALDYNMKLSSDRAKAVMNRLVEQYKIPAERLKTFGVGPLAPVASNKTDSGRARNRRVELVEQ